MARRTVEGAFAKGRFNISVTGAGRNVEVLADDLLPDLLTQLFLLLGDSAPQERDCRLSVEVGTSEDSIDISISSDGFALSPIITDALTGDREPHGWTRHAASISLVHHLLRQYRGVARLVSAPPGKVGAHLVIELPRRKVDDAVDYDSG
jgi:hypothetical protein